MFIHLSIDKTFGFLFLAIMNDAAMNICIHNVCFFMYKNEYHFITLLWALKKSKYIEGASGEQTNKC